MRYSTTACRNLFPALVPIFITWVRYISSFTSSFDFGSLKIPLLSAILQLRMQSAFSPLIHHRQHTLAIHRTPSLHPSLPTHKNTMSSSRAHLLPRHPQCSGCVFPNPSSENTPSLRSTLIIIGCMLSFVLLFWLMLVLHVRWVMGVNGRAARGMGTGGWLGRRRQKERVRGKEMEMETEWGSGGVENLSKRGLLGEV
jgi:hypothetical protein